MRGSRVSCCFTVCILFTSLLCLTGFDAKSFLLLCYDFLVFGSFSHLYTKLFHPHLFTSLQSFALLHSRESHPGCSLQTKAGVSQYFGPFVWIFCLSSEQRWRVCVLISPLFDRNGPKVSAFLWFPDVLPRVRALGGSVGVIKVRYIRREWGGEGPALCLSNTVRAGLFSLCGAFWAVSPK